jgi:hypothetical protein
MEELEEALQVGHVVVVHASSTSSTRWIDGEERVCRYVYVCTRYKSMKVKVPNEKKRESMCVYIEREIYI